MLSAGTAGRLMAMRCNGATSQVPEVFVKVWLFMRRHVDLLRLASALCRPRDRWLTSSAR
jgi:hypothetical protein